MTTGRVWNNKLHWELSPTSSHLVPSLMVYSRNISPRNKYRLKIRPGRICSLPAWETWALGWDCSYKLCFLITSRRHSRTGWPSLSHHEQRKRIFCTGILVHLHTWSPTSQCLVGFLSKRHAPFRHTGLLPGAALLSLRSGQPSFLTASNSAQDFLFPILLTAFMFFPFKCQGSLVFSPYF